MNMDHEQKRTAWLDGELPPDEATAFWAELPEADRTALEQEKQLDERIAGLLATPAVCPERAWARAKAAVWEAEADTTRKRFALGRLALAAAPIAAVFVVVFALLVPANSDATPTFLKVAGATVPELAQQSAVQGEREHVEQFMRQYGFNFSLDEIQLPAHEVEEGRPLKLIGARAATYRGETVIMLLFACCNKPAQMVLIARGGEAEQAIRAAMEKKSIRMTRELCPQYMGAVVGDTDRAGHILALLKASE